MYARGCAVNARTSVAVVMLLKQNRTRHGGRGLCLLRCCTTILWLWLFVLVWVKNQYSLLPNPFLLGWQGEICCKCQYAFGDDDSNDFNLKILTAEEILNRQSYIFLASRGREGLGMAVMLLLSACLFLPLFVKAQTGGLTSADAETRLQEVYTLIGQARNRDALAKAEALVQDFPHFQLGQLVYADLLQAQYKPVAVLGSAPEAITRAAPGVLSELREESRLRVQALKEKIPAGSVPDIVNNIGNMHQHLIFVDSDKGRLYLFASQSGSMRLVKDYYISVGRAGVSKRVEGDLRTPLGIYFISSRLNGKNLDDLYGWGALPIDYPNPLDKRLGRTGSGIWLHGTPSKQYSRAPQATEGCVAIANPHMREIMATVATRSTPVVIANGINWVGQQQAQSAPENAFLVQWSQWRAAVNRGALSGVLPYYDNSRENQRATAVKRQLMRRLKARKGVFTKAEDVSVLQSRDDDGRELVVASYRQSTASGKPGVAMRQYWLRQNDAAGTAQWKIFDERSM